MGKAKLQAELGVSKDKAENCLTNTMRKFPLLNTNEPLSNRAQERGQIRTLLGRLCRFHLWEPNSLVCIRLCYMKMH